MSKTEAQLTIEAGKTYTNPLGEQRTVVRLANPLGTRVGFYVVYVTPEKPDKEKQVWMNSFMAWYKKKKNYAYTPYKRRKVDADYISGLLKFMVDNSGEGVEAGRILRDVQLYDCGRKGMIPKEWEEWRDRYDRANDPEYQEYLRLKAKFEK